jgi:heat shock protein HslJ
MLALVVLVAACGGDDDDNANDDDNSPTTAEPGGGQDLSGSLAGRTFVATDVQENGQPRPLVEGTELAVSFDEGGISISAGCNSMSGAAVISDDTIEAGDLVTTEMGCDPPRHAQDDWVANLFATGVDYTLIGNELVVTLDGTVITLVDEAVASPDRPLEETVWQLDGLVDGDAVSSLPVGTAATAVFADGEVVIENEGCNRARGPAEIAGSEITIGPLMMTKMGCEPDPTTVEQALTKALDGTVTYTIDAGSLSITNPNGAGLTFFAGD